MIQRQIVIKGLGKQIDIEDAAYRTYAIIDFHSIAWIFIFVSVTIYRTVPLHRYQSGISHFIMLTTNYGAASKI
jgi:hypothetical protein